MTYNHDQRRGHDHSGGREWDRDHSCEHGHSHGFGHTHHSGGSSPNKKALQAVFFITFFFFFVELIGGLITNSLALISDAIHMFSDAASLGLSWVAILLALKPATPKYTFGLKRAEVLAALFNALTLIVVSLFIFKEAWERFQNPPVVESALMIAIAVTGLAVNLLGAWILYRSNPWDNLNMRGAFLHVIGDALGSLGAISAGIIMFYTGIYLADPVISVFIGALILFSAIRLMGDTLHVLLEGSPGHIPYQEVHSALAGADGVIDVRDLHIWTLTSGFDALSSKVIVEHGADHQVILDHVRGMLCDTYGLEHITIQLEEGSGPEM